jgi:hypothetical protein
VYPELRAYIDNRISEFHMITPERTAALRRLAEYTRNRSTTAGGAQLTFICTHNSRRSHLSQVWAQTAAAWYSVANVATFSGGTEATAFNPRAAAALERAGFQVRIVREGKNPVYEVSRDDSSPPRQVFSKVYNEEPNPGEGFGAVMTCSQADEACPVVFGSDYRVSIPYDDPKEFDGSAAEAAGYDERCRQISREMLYLFSHVSDAGH